MAIEIEAKMKVDSHDPVRRRLREVGAAPAGEHLETNIFFDTPDGALKAAGKGLRVRLNRSVPDGAMETIVTFKGPLQPGPFKTRQEIELVVDHAESAAALWEALGFSQIFSFEKRRQTWKLDECKVEMDELPCLGTYVEIEGPSEKAVAQVREKLGLKQPSIQTGYIALLMEHLRKIGSDERNLVFPPSA